MPEEKETYIETRKVCPFRLIAFGIHHGDVNVQYCIREQCAWYLICYNLSNLAEILARTLINIAFLLSGDAGW